MLDAKLEAKLGARLGAESEAKLEIISLTAGYGERQVLKGLSFKVRRGEVIALIGPNGAGKTTLVRVISGVLAPQSGQIRLNGRDARRMSPAERAACLAVVPQARDLPADFTVWQTVLLGRTPYLGWLGQASPKDLQRVQWSLERTRLTGIAGRRVGELSGGEQQRVLLARALAQDTPVLLLDEPTSHLDLQHQSLLLNLVAELARDQGLAVLMAVHDLNLAALYADQVALLAGGELQAFGRPQEVLTSGLLGSVYQIPIKIVPHPDYGTPLILPDGFRQTGNGTAGGPEMMSG